MSSGTPPAVHNATATNSLSKFQQLAIVLFMGGYFAVVLLGLMPNCALKKTCAPTVDSVLRLSGWEQQWNMFSPGVRSINLHMMAITTYADGSCSVREFPRMEKSDLWTKFRREKMRKVFVDRLSTDEYRAYWPALARFVAHEERDPRNQPVEVVLACNWVEMPAPDEKHWVDRAHLPEHLHHRTLFVYQVDPADLQ